ncbi:MAG: glycosyltransferase family 39 protein [Candidatus Sulfopaludibacter sp.]|nr:glycosyltransferase family 39 protein [Candidatus Sulfopaludibacter sp.]
MQHAPPEPSRFLEFLEKHCRSLSLVLVLFASMRIVSTYTVFNHTADEPAHIACGMEWLDKGVYTLEAQHPPLARVASAVGPYLLGARTVYSPQTARDWLLLDGAAILYHGRHYDLTLALSRLGILPFFWVGCLVVYLWGRRYFNGAIAVPAVFLFSFMPPVLAHAGLSTTDMALTAFLGAAFLSGYIWLEEPTRRHAVWFGICTALMMLSKFSGMAFLPVSVGLALLWYMATDRPGAGRLWRVTRDRLPTLALAVLVACLTIWAGYRFSFGKADFSSIRLPAPELYQGIEEVMYHNSAGHPGYLLGERRSTGFWYFYEVALAVKTPLGFLVLLFAGVFLAFRHRRYYRELWPPLLFAAGILLVGAFSRINIGIRHVLPVYMGFSLVAAAALARGIENAGGKRWVIAGAGAMTLWMAVSSLIGHPDYLAYFNELADSRPENILVDSDLDWGQDVKRLSARLKQVHAKEVAFTSLITADLEGEHGFPHRTAGYPNVPSHGWNAIGKTYWKEYRLGLFDTHPGVTPWPDRVPEQEQIGKSILLYYFP